MTSRFALAVIALLTLSTSALAAVKKPTPLTITGGELIDAAGMKPMWWGSQANLLIVDSRIVPEFREGHIPGSLNMPFAEMGALRAKLPADKNHPLCFYCNGPKCWKSYDAALLAIQWGYGKVYWFRDGLPAWRKAHLPVVIGN